MARFNQNNSGSYGHDTVNLAGGVAYDQPAEEAFVHLLLTSFFQDQYYRNQAEIEDTLCKLMDDIDDKLFLAQAAIFARTHFGMRTVSHVVAAELAKYISGCHWGKAFYEKVVYRVDDMTEILSYYFWKIGLTKDASIPNSMKKGFAKAFDKFDAYHLAKYRMADKKIKLVDLVNLVHPKPTEKNRKALQMLVRDSLRNADTWEAMLSAAGQNLTEENDTAALKAKAWKQLVTTRKIGYLALLRNVRNILDQAPSIASNAAKMLTDRELIKKSMVMPFQIFTAIHAVAYVPVKMRSHSYRQGFRPNSVLTREKKMLKKEERLMLKALETALELSLDNVPKLDGRTAIVLDTSGSMNGQPSLIGSLFAAVLAKTNECDLMLFDNDARYVAFNPSLSVRAIAESIHFAGGGTNFPSIFEKMDKPYDRIVILSDMQAWGTEFSPAAALEDYRKRFACDPLVYSWDLQGYGTTQFVGRRVVPVAGFSDKAFDFMKNVEEGTSKIIEMIRAVEIG